MKKTVTANVSGTVFHIEEDAYDRLQRYLSGIRAQFEGTDGREEIMADIEARIAELFRERLDERRNVVSIDDVEHVVAVMGQPEDYGDGASSAAGEPAPGAPKGKHQKRFFRDPDDKWVGGVIGGLGAYLGTDPLWLRIAMIVFFFLGSGTPFLLYVILWILVPVAASSADRLRMGGEAVTVDNLKRAFEEGGTRVASEAKDLGRKWGNEAKQQSTNAGEVIIKIIGVIVVITGLSMLIGLVTSMIGGAFGLWHAGLSAGELGVVDLAALVVGSHQHAIWLGIGLITLCLIPIIAILLAGFRMMLNTRTPGWLVWLLALLWFGALVPTIISAFTVMGQFRREAKVREEVELAAPSQDILYLDALELADTAFHWSVSFDRGSVDMDLDGLHVADGMVTGAWASIDVETSPDSLYRLVTVRESRGRNGKQALGNAQRITGRYRQDGDALLISPAIRFPQEDGIRGQDLNYTLLVPVGKQVFFRTGSDAVIHDVENVTDTYDSDMLGKAWRMTPQGLEESRPSEAPKEATPADEKKKEEPAQRNRAQPPAAEVRLPNVLDFLRMAI